MPSIFLGVRVRRDNRRRGQSKLWSEADDEILANRDGGGPINLVVDP
jgi:hypothetical protein